MAQVQPKELALLDSIYAIVKAEGSKLAIDEFKALIEAYGLTDRYTFSGDD